jgi:hypothetical protein
MVPTAIKNASAEGIRMGVFIEGDSLLVEGYNSGLLMGLIQNNLYDDKDNDPDYHPVPGSTSGNVEADFKFETHQGNGKAAAVTGRIEFEPDTVFQWPGGSYDKGETPKGLVYGFTIYDPDGGVVLQVGGLMKSFAELTKARTATALEKLLFGGNDIMDIVGARGLVRSGSGDDEIRFYFEGALGHGGKGNDTLTAKHNAEAGLSQLFGDGGNDTLQGSEAGIVSVDAGRDRLDGGGGSVGISTLIHAKGI